MPDPSSQLSTSSLQSHVGKSIDEICANGFSSPTQNHCAHFVSHALGLKLGMLCGDMLFKTKGTGASIRCDEIYNRLKTKGPWEERPKYDQGLLIFVLSAKNILGGTMLNVPQKHVGIHFDGKVYNFSNSQHKVVVDATVDAFHAKFKALYAGGDISLYYGVAG